jgi:hypothetical protein
MQKDDVEEGALRKTIRQLLTKFPTYEMKSDEGFCQAIHDMEADLLRVGYFDPLPRYLHPNFPDDKHADSTEK